MNNSSNKLVLIFSTALLIAGNIVGAGMLGLPINTGPAGLLPTVCSMLVMWILMFISAWVVAQQSIRAKSDNFDLPSLFGKALGPSGRWIAIISNLIILYGLIVAYLAGASVIIIDLFDLRVSQHTVMIGFFFCATFLTLFGLKIVRQSNAIMMAGLVSAFCYMLYVGSRHINLNNFAHTEWKYAPLALPIMATAFHFHNIIPSICRSLNWEGKAIKQALFWGSGMGLIVNLAWVIMVMGALPLQGEGEISILYALKNNQPATIPLSKLLHSPVFTTMSLVFAFLAIITSYLANGAALMSFIKDLLTATFGKSDHFLEMSLAFLVPLGITFFYPNIFLTILDIVGGIGIVSLFGILPGLLYIRSAKNRQDKHIGYLLFVTFSFVLLFQIANMAGFIHLNLPQS
jgi:tyrosine-specific transport protein